MTQLASERAETLRLIAESAAFLTEPAQIARARGLRWTTPGFDRDMWRSAAELGWLGLRVPEGRGGSGLGVAELCVLSERLGGALAPEPLAEAMCLAPALPPDVSTDVLSGALIVLPTWREARCEGAPVRFNEARLHGAGFRARMGGGADIFAVFIDDGLVLVRANAAGVAIIQARLQDGGHFATIDFDGAASMLLPASSAKVHDELTLVTAAYLLGVMRRAFQITRDYVVVRKQFGQSVGSFQVVQHRMADLHIQIELVAASVAQAAELMDEDRESTIRQLAVSRAKARASDAAMLVTKQGVQLHGGMGFTDEADIGLFLRKALVLSNLYGSAAFHRRRYATLLDLGAARHAA